MTIEQLNFPEGHPLQGSETVISVINTYRDQFRFLVSGVYRFSLPTDSSYRRQLTVDKGKGVIQPVENILGKSRSEPTYLRKEGDLFATIGFLNGQQRVYDILIYSKPKRNSVK